MYYDCETSPTNDVIEHLRHRRIQSAVDPDSGQLLARSQNDQRQTGDLTILSHDPSSPYTPIGMYVFSRDVFKSMYAIEPPWRGLVAIIDATQVLLIQDYPVYSHAVEWLWKDTENPKDVIDGNRFVLRALTFRLEGDGESDAEVINSLQLPAS